MKETRFIIMRRQGERVQFLAHEGCKHYWAPNRSEAMEYTKLYVAESLAKMQDGEVQPID